MSGFKIDIKNFKNVTDNLGKVIKNAEEKVNKELHAFGVGVVADAKRNVPVDEGILRNSINYKQEGLIVTINVSANYAAYLEFGTRKFAAKYVASLPPDWQTFAAQFKGGGGGSFEDLVMRITEWVMRKKIGATYNVKTKRRDRVGKQSAATTARADAYAIALHIVRNGIMPQPYLRPAVDKNLIELKKRL